MSKEKASQIPREQKETLNSRKKSEKEIKPHPQNRKNMSKNKETK
jgi:hypothetical protein